MLHSLLKYVWAIATLLWFLLSTYLSHQNGDSTAQTSLKLAEMLGNEEWNGGLRRAAHVVVFLVLAVLVSLTLKCWDLDKRWVFLVFVWCIVDEATKPLVDGRHFQIIDVGLNEVGTVIGVVIGAVIRFLV